MAGFQWKCNQPCHPSSGLGPPVGKWEDLLGLSAIWAHEVRIMAPCIPCLLPIVWNFHGWWLFLRSCMQCHLYLVYTKLKAQILFPVGNIENTVAEPLVCSLLSQTYPFINSFVFFPVSHPTPQQEVNPNTGETYRRSLNHRDAKSNWNSSQETQ